jgi:hypothetical protein
MAYIGREPTVGNFQVCDDITVVNGQAAYTMQVSSVNVLPESANHCLVSLNGVLQKSSGTSPSFTISASTITFASNLVTGDVINFIHILGSVLDLGVPSDSTVSIAKLTATGTKNSTTFLRGDNTFAAAGGGKILQVVTASESAARTITSTSYVNSSNGLSVDITPAATSSKIYIIVSLGYFTCPSGQNMSVTVFRDSTNLAGGDGGIGLGMHGGFSEAIPYAAHVVDSPSSTSELTYQVYAKVTGSSGQYGHANSKATITAMEIGA